MVSSRPTPSRVARTSASTRSKALLRRRVGLSAKSGSDGAKYSGVSSPQETPHRAPAASRSAWIAETVSVLYHLAKLGWSEVLLVERTELTAGSTWHAAADFHTLNADPNIAALQKYTIDLYQALETETGMSCGISMSGGVNFAATPQRWEWLRAQWAQFQTIGIDTARLIGVDEIVELCPFIDPSGIEGGLLNTCEGHIDAAALTHEEVNDHIGAPGDQVMTAPIVAFLEGCLR